MCTYQFLVQSSHGYISRCDSCENIQVGYGTTVMSFTRGQFYEFARSVVGSYQMHHKSYMEYQKKICIATITRLILLVYSICELKILSEMLEDACMTLGFEKLMTEIDS